MQRDSGDLEEALDSLQTAANIASNLLGNHEDTTYSSYFLGLVQCDMGDLEEALDSLQKSSEHEIKCAW